MIITSKIASHSGIQAAIDAALQGARVARAVQLEGLNPQQKSSDVDDLVTEGDEASQRAILEILPTTLEWEGKREAVDILAEEKHEGGVSGARLRWVIDPIDGTLPYSRGTAFWCVSIALQERVDSDWVSRLGVLYQASEDDTPAKLSGKLFYADGSKAMVHDLKSDVETTLSQPVTIIPEAELGASGAFATQAKEEFSRRNIPVRFRRSICHAVTEMLLGRLCAVVQDAGPLEWDIAAALPIAKLAGAHVLVRRAGSVGACDRYATVFAWDKEVFDFFCSHLPYAVL